MGYIRSEDIEDIGEELGEAMRDFYDKYKGTYVMSTIKTVSVVTLMLGSLYFVL